MKFLRNKESLDRLLQQSLNYVKHNHVQSNFQHCLLLTVSRRLAVQARIYVSTEHTNRYGGPVST